MPGRCLAAGPDGPTSDARQAAEPSGAPAGAASGDGGLRRAARSGLLLPASPSSRADGLPACRAIRDRSAAASGCGDAGAAGERRPNSGGPAAAARREATPPSRRYGCPACSGPAVDTLRQPRLVASQQSIAPAPRFLFARRRRPPTRGARPRRTCRGRPLRRSCASCGWPLCSTPSAPGALAGSVAAAGGRAAPCMHACMGAAAAAHHLPRTLQCSASSPFAAEWTSWSAVSLELARVLKPCLPARTRV